VPCFGRIEIVTLVGITIPVWLKCRQRRPPFLSILLNRVPPSGSAVQKKLDEPFPVRAAMGMFHLPFHFVRDDQELNAQLFPSSSRRVRIAAALAV
jgi:hypothetical protein